MSEIVDMSYSTYNRTTPRPNKACLSSSISSIRLPDLAPTGFGSKAQPPLQSFVRHYEQYAKLDVTKRIHVIGSGAVGKLVAHALRGLSKDPPPVTMVYFRPRPYTEMLNAKNTLTLVSGQYSESHDGFDIELVKEGPRKYVTGSQTSLPERSEKYRVTHPGGDELQIHNLVVSVQAYSIIGALANVTHRLFSDSSILFLNTGMGIIDEVNERLFPDPATRPNYLIGVNSHGVSSDGPCHVKQYSNGTLTIGLLPRHPYHQQIQTPIEQTAPQAKLSAPEIQANLQSLGLKQSKKYLSKREMTSLSIQKTWPSSSRYLLRTIMRCPSLGAIAVSPSDLFQTQLEALAVMCLIEPLTVALDCRNGQLLNNFAVSRTFYLLLAEITLIIQSLPELRGIPNVPLRFSAERLEARTVDICRKTARELSVSLQHVRRGYMTEIDYLNGYIVKRGEELGIKPVMNYMLMQMVVGKQQMIQKEMQANVPYARPVEE